MKYKGIIFDFNGVMLWDDDWHKQAWNELGKDIIGREVLPHEFLEFWGRPNKGVLEYLLNRPPSEEELQKAIGSKEEKYRNIAIKQKDFVLSPGVESLLEILNDLKMPFTIATSSEINNVQFFFKHLNLGKWFNIKEVIYDTNTFPGKPAPDIYLKAAKKIKLPPKECIVIEDAKSGIEAAYKAGIGKIIALSHGNEAALRKLRGVKKVVNNLGEITKQDFED